MTFAEGLPWHEAHKVSQHYLEEKQAALHFIHHGELQECWEDVAHLAWLLLGMKYGQNRNNTTPPAANLEEMLPKFP